jgi:diacylglycerol kinase
MKESRNKDTGNFLSRRIKSFHHALDGIKYAYLYEQNMKLIILAMILVILAGFYFKITALEWLICILCFALVSATEMINTAIEATIDLITLKQHPLAKIAKDTAASATLIFCIASFIIACIIFIPYIF